jgi:hypothetical protein
MNPFFGYPVLGGVSLPSPSSNFHRCRLIRSALGIREAVDKGEVFWSEDKNIVCSERYRIFLC